MEGNDGREEVSIRAHDPEFARLYLNNYNSLLAYVWVRTGINNPAVADEIVQEVFREALLHWDEIALSRYPERWLLSKVFEKTEALWKKGGT